MNGTFSNFSFTTSLWFVLILLSSNLLISFRLVFGRPDLPWSWDTVPLWADFDIRTWRTPWYTQDQARFMGETYQVLSLEKCLGGSLWYDDGELEGEEAFYELAQGIRNFTNETETKILYYWNIDILYGDCYNNTKDVLYGNDTKWMWVTDDDGEQVYATLDTRPYINHTIEAVREWWIDTAVDVIREALNRNISVNGIFADGMCVYIVYKGISSARNSALNEGIMSLLKEARTRFKEEFGEDFLFIGNGLFSYTVMENNCRNPLNYTDGAMIEHFGAFEEVGTNGEINGDYLYNWVNVVYNETVYNNKSIFVKGWIGPESSPITGLGPSWDDGWTLSGPNNYSQVQQVARELLTFPLSVFLCGLVREYVYFSYAWWYSIDQGYWPCYEKNECTVPEEGWYPEFSWPLGKPLMEPQWKINDTSKICFRSFEYVNVTVDLDDQNSGTIIWNVTWPTAYPTNIPTIEPSDEPTSDPTIQPSDEPSVEPTNGPTNDPTIEPSNEPSVSPSKTPSQNPSVEPTTAPSTSSSGNGNNANSNASSSGSNSESGATIAIIVVTSVIGVAILIALGIAYFKGAIGASGSGAAAAAAKSATAGSIAMGKGTQIPANSPVGTPTGTPPPMPFTNMQHMEGAGTAGGTGTDIGTDIGTSDGATNTLSVENTNDRPNMKYDISSEI